MQTVNPETFICDSIFYYQVTGDKEGFDRMINEEMSSKLREALAKCMEFGKKIDESLGSDESTVWTCRYERSYAKAIEEIAKEALAEPVRNCDVVTADEQYNRFIHCCTSRKIPCRRSDTFSCTKCYAVWSQLPYESEVNE